MRCVDFLLVQSHVCHSECSEFVFWVCCRMESRLQGFVDWKDIFLDQISKDVKLVGSTISCQPFVNATDSNEDGGNPYVQAYAVATDLVSHLLFFYC